MTLIDTVEYSRHHGNGIFLLKLGMIGQKFEALYDGWNGNIKEGRKVGRKDGRKERVVMQ
jgi:hypothetical protein